MKQCENYYVSNILNYVSFLNIRLAKILDIFGNWYTKKYCHCVIIPKGIFTHSLLINDILLFFSESILFHMHQNVNYCESMLRLSYVLSSVESFYIIQWFATADLSNLLHLLLVTCWLILFCSRSVRCYKFLIFHIFWFTLRII